MGPHLAFVPASIGIRCQRLKKKKIMRFHIKAQISGIFQEFRTFGSTARIAEGRAGVEGAGAAALLRVLTEPPPSGLSSAPSNSLCPCCYSARGSGNLPTNQVQMSSEIPGRAGSCLPRVPGSHSIPPGFSNLQRVPRGLGPRHSGSLINTFAAIHIVAKSQRVFIPRLAVCDTLG